MPTGRTSTRKLLEHHVRIHVSQRRMPKRAGQRSGDRKAMLLPQPHRSLVRRHNQIVLHGAETSRTGSACECSHISDAMPRPRAAAATT